MKQSDKKKAIIALVIVVLCLVSYFIFKLSDNNKLKNNNIVKNSEHVTNFDSDLGDPTRDVEASDIETSQLKDAYIQKIKNDSTNNSISLSDYKINEITFMEEEQKKAILEMDNGAFYKSTDTFAYLTYSVKPENNNYKELMGAGAEKNGDWITYKNIYVCIRDGNIISAGTSW